MKNRKLKLQQKIIFFIMLGMFVGFSGFIYVNYLFMRQTATIEIHDKLRVKSQNLTKSIQKWLEDKQNMAIALAKQATKLKDKTPK